MPEQSQGPVTLGTFTTTPMELAAALAFGSLATEFCREAETLPVFTAWLRARGARGIPVDAFGVQPARLLRYDLLLTELAYAQGQAAGR